MVEKVKRAECNTVSPVQNGKHHDKNGLNGHVNGCKNETAIHPKIVGPSTIAIMQLWSNSSLPKNDCRFILRRLIRTGNVSVRNHLIFPSLFYHMENKSKKVNDKSCYLPLELMHDMLDHCTDVSESAMVLSLKFLLSRMSDEDIASFFRKSKRKCLTTIDMIESDRSSTTRLLATVDLFAKILEYSPCNDGILRTTISSLLTSQETSLLVKIMVQFRQPTAGHAPGFRLTQNYIAWLTSIVDVANDLNDDAECLRDVVRRWIHDEFSTSHEMLALCVKVRQRLSEKTSTEVHTEAKEWSNVALAGYQIERVQF